MNELSVSKDYLPQAYTGMITKIKEFMPEFNRSVQFFMKRQSQLMDNVLTVNHPTPLRNLRQILSEMNRMKLAIAEANYKIKLRENRIEKLMQGIDGCKDDCEYKYIQIKIDRKREMIEFTKESLAGSIRKMANLVEKYNEITKNKNIKDWTEVDFELEEEKYHIMKVTEQAVCAARARGGVVDEGNHIYAAQLGMNGATFQYYVTQFLNEEAKALKEGIEPDNNALLKFQNFMYEKFKGCVVKIQNEKGMTGQVCDYATIDNKFFIENVTNGYDERP